MKNKIITPLLIILSPFVLMGQNAKISDIPDFDKIVIKGEVKEMIIQGMGNSQTVDIEGIAQEEVSYHVLAGTLELNVEKSAEPVTLKVYNKNLKRISGPENMKITGVETIGGGSGNYLVTSFKPNHFPDLVWCKGVDVDIDIPALSFDIDVPEFNFDFPDDIVPNFDFNLHMDQEELREWQEDLKENQEKIKEMSQEWSEDLRENMERLHEEMDKRREEAEQEREKAQEHKE